MTIGLYVCVPLGVGVTIGLTTTVGVPVGVPCGVGVLVGVFPGVGVLVGVLAGVGVTVRVGVLIGVFCGVGVAVMVTVGEGVGVTRGVRTGCNVGAGRSMVAVATTGGLPRYTVGLAGNGEVSTIVGVATQGFGVLVGAAFTIAVGVFITVGLIGGTVAVRYADLTPLFNRATCPQRGQLVQPAPYAVIKSRDILIHMTKNSNIITIARSLRLRFHSAINVSIIFPCYPFLPPRLTTLHYKRP